MRLGISRLHFPVTTLGPGRRCGVWVQGCSLGCHGCLSRDTWSTAADDQQTSVADVVSWLAQHAGVSDGITISGGEPFDQPDALQTLLETLGAHPATSHLTTLVYSGYSMNRLRNAHEELLQLMDAVITGPFIESQPSLHPWMGSANQQLHVLRDRAAVQFSEPLHDQPRLQLAATDGQVWITGIPRRGDLGRMERRLVELGVLLEDVSWRS